MTDEPIASHSFCVVAGCTSPGTVSRWVSVADGDRREIEVCWKHETGDLTIADLEPDIDWTGGATT
jgi:hypothetical protein